MEKFSQFRDRGSGISPFLPVSRPSASAYLPILIFLFVARLPIFVAVVLSHFLVLRWLPLGSLVRKASLWLILGVSGIWWIDLQIDGVKKGSLAKQHASRLPQPSDIIAASFMSPIDALYLAAIFDPIFTASYSSTRQVRRVRLLGAILRAFRPPRERPGPGAPLVDLRSLIEANPKRIVVVFPETTTTNGNGILSLGPSLLSAPPGAKIFPVSLRYTPADITTPLPHSYRAFLWNLLSEPTHCIRVRIAACVYHPPKPPVSTIRPGPSYASSVLETSLGEETGTSSSTETLASGDETSSAAEPSVVERKTLDRVADALARLGRAKRVGLGTRDKIAFVESWNQRGR